MKTKKIFSIIVLISFTFFSNAFDEKPNYVDYFTKNIQLFRNFIGLDVDNSKVSKLNFLEKLATGKYYITKESNKKQGVYKLNLIPSNTDNYTPLFFKSVANTNLKYLSMEGKPLPKFDFTDLYGKNFNAENCKGKVVVLKFWFLRCRPCIAEMPILNDIVSEYANKEDIVFLSLAHDETDQLVEFLKKVKFQYSTAGNLEKYMKFLGIEAYPTHIIVNRKGLVEKVLNSAYELEEYLKLKAYPLKKPKFHELPKILAPPGPL